jgi:hypothetical protein
VRETLDWGRIVFLLVDAGLLNRQEEDKIEDFKDGFDFDEAFVKKYKPKLPPETLAHPPAKGAEPRRDRPTLPDGAQSGALVLFGLLSWFCWTVRSVLNPLILAYLLAFILHPLVLTLERRGWKRRSAVNFIFGAFLALLTLLGFLIVQQGRGMSASSRRSRGFGAGPRADRRGVHNTRRRSTGRCGSSDKEKSERQTTPGDTMIVSGELRSYEDLQRFCSRRSTTGCRERDTAEPDRRRGGRHLPAAPQRVRGRVLVPRPSLLLPIYTWFLLFELEGIHGFLQRYLPSRERARSSRSGRRSGRCCRTSSAAGCSCASARDRSSRSASGSRESSTRS